MKGKVVYLFGAGAAIPWKGPRTDELTEIILNSGFFCNDRKTRVTKRIFDILSNYFKPSEINFETIMNVLEELLVIHSSHNYLDTNSFLLPFIKIKDLVDDIFNYEMNGNVQHGFSLSIPNHTLESSQHAYQNQSPKQFYLQLLYANILAKISERVSLYSYHTQANSKIFSDDNEILNSNFYHWILNESNSSNSSIRLYTLNYDRLFSVILKKNNFNVFEGAECGAEVGHSEEIPFDIKKIVTDFECNTCYNLHGSSFWEVESRNHNQLPSVQYFLTGVPNLSCNLWEQPLVQMEKGKTINPSNIITGYQKIQKTSISPFRQMQSAFDRDCIEANRIYIVGYSFGDIHINECIKNSLVHSPETQIIIIDPNFKKNELDNKIGIELLSNSNLSLDPTNLGGKSFSFLNGKVIVCEEYFDEYLKKKRS